VKLLAFIVTVTVGSVTACSSGEDPPIPTSGSDPVETPAPEVSVIVGAAELDSGPVAELDHSDYDIDPIGVLLAALIIMGGDVEEAVASGILRPIEVDVALLAMSTDSLDDWTNVLSVSSAAQVRPAIRAHSSRRPTVRWNSIDSRSS
jgi:hypothetical protein